MRAKETVDLPLREDTPTITGDFLIPTCARCFSTQSLAQSPSDKDIVSTISAIRQKYPQSFLLFTKLPPRLYSLLCSSRAHIWHSKSTYIPSTGDLLIYPMPTPPHGFVVSFFQHSLLRTLVGSSQITWAEYDGLAPISHSVGLPSHGTPTTIGAKIPVRIKEADWAVGVRVGEDRKPPEIPMIVMECGVSQKEQDLGLDARQWLFRSVNPDVAADAAGSGVRCVALVKIIEGPRRHEEAVDADQGGGDEHKDDSDTNEQDDLAATDSDESTMALYTRVKTTFEASPNLTAAWAGEISAWIELWRLDRNGVVKMDERIRLLPVQPTANAELRLRRTDLGLEGHPGNNNELRIPLEELVMDLKRHARTRLAYSRWVRKRGPVKAKEMDWVQN